MDDNITRRRVLTAIATAGGIGTLGGAGTYAVFSDSANTRATFTSGSLDLRVHCETTYEGAETRTDSAVIDGQKTAVLPGYDDLKPDDSGQMKFRFELTTNPAYLWLCGDLTTSSDLADAMSVEVQYCEPDRETIARGSLESVFSSLAGGIALDDNGANVEPGEQTAYDPSPSSEETTGPCLCIDWNLSDVGNEIQNDEVGFDLRFHAVQACHHDGTNNTCLSWSRLRLLLSDSFMTIVAVLVVLALLGSWFTYTTHVAPGTHVENRTVADWETTGAFAHSATVTNGSGAFSNGTTLSNQSACFTAIAPVLDGTFSYSCDASNGSLASNATLQFVLHPVGETDGNATEYWRITRDLGGERETSLAPGETLEVSFSQNMNATRELADRIEERIGGSPGTVEALVVA